MQQVAKTKDGATIAFSMHKASEPETARALFLHSLGMDRSNWTEVVEALPGDISAVLMDVRGHGLSVPGQNTLTMEAAVDDVATVLETVGWESAIVIGSSMGGCIAQGFALAHPEALDGLVLVDTTAWYGPEASEAWSGRAQKAEREGFEALVPFQRERWFTPKFIEEKPEALQRCIDVFVKNRIETYKAACAMLAEWDARDKLHKISAPTAVIVGEEDYATPLAMAALLGEKIPNAYVHVIEAARHFTPIEAPDEIIQGIKRVTSQSSTMAAEIAE